MHQEWRAAREGIRNLRAGMARKKTKVNLHNINELITPQLARSVVDAFGPAEVYKIQLQSGAAREKTEKDRFVQAFKRITGYDIEGGVELNKIARALLALVAAERAGRN